MKQNNKNGQTHFNRPEEEVKQEVLSIASHGPSEVRKALKALKKKWSAEKVLTLNASVLGLAGIVLGFVISRNFLFVPALVSALVGQQAIQGWNPLMPLLKKLGFRTQSEMEHEKYALKAVQGHFGNKLTPGKAWRAVSDN